MQTSPSATEARPTAPTPRDDRLRWLDLLRFLAAFAVVVVHARGHAIVDFGSLPPEQRTAPVAAFFALTRVGNEAVTVFFVLSGFLVGGKALERIAAGTFRLRDYAIDRVSRIYVPLLPALALTAVVAGAIDADRSFGSLVGNLAGLQGIAVDPFGLNRPLWSLAYEIWFYVLAGAIGVGAVHRGLHLRAAAAVVLVAALFTILSPTFLFCWLIGALAWVRRPSRLSPAMACLAAALIVYGVAGVEAGMESRTVKGPSIVAFLPPWGVAHLLLSTGMALLIQQLVAWTPRAAWLAAIERVGTPLGAFSYTLYLVHYPVIRAIVPHLGGRLERVDARSLGSVALLTAASVAVSVVLYFLFERHTGRVRGWLRGALGAR